MKSPAPLSGWEYPSVGSLGRLLSRQVVLDRRQIDVLFVLDRDLKSTLSFTSHSFILPDCAFQAVQSPWRRINCGAASTVAAIGSDDGKATGAAVISPCLHCVLGLSAGHFLPDTYHSSAAEPSSAFLPAAERITLELPSRDSCQPIQS